MSPRVASKRIVVENGTCLVNYKIFLEILKTHPQKKILMVEVDERRLTFATTTLPVTEFSNVVVSPGNFQVFRATDELPVRRAEMEAKLPNAENAIVEQEKILDYLLNPNHPIGATKAKFFAKLGFAVEKWDVLANALLVHGQTNEVKRVRETEFGPQYSVEGAIKAPDGRAPFIRSVWQMDKGAVAPRLITAYPLEAR